MHRSRKWLALTRGLQETSAIFRPYNAKMNAPLHSLTTYRILKVSLAASLSCGLWSGVALAQENPQSAPAGNESKPADASTNSSHGETQAETLNRCWQMLTNNVQDTKHFEARTQALNALSDLGSNRHADSLIAAAMKDSNLDVRTAAVLAAGKTKSRSLVEPVRKLLDDPEPQVVFVAATTLWKQLDRKSVV